MFKLQPKKTCQNFLSPKSKKGAQNRENRDDCEESSDLDFLQRQLAFKTHSININEIENETSVCSITFTSNELPILHKIDTGTQYNVVPLKMYKKLKPQPDPLNLKPSAYNNSEIPLIGKSPLPL